MATCAGTNTIAALLAGAADPTEAERLELHLDACPACRRLVADLGRGLSAIGEPAERLPAPGEQLGRYALRRVIGVGGMGVVYEAQDLTLQRRVAVKLLRPDLRGGPSLFAEAQAMARLQHPNIVTVHDASLANGQLYLCMEYVAGATLRAWTAAHPRDWRAIVDVFVAAGEGLAYVHRAGLVHLDFKPDNVLVDDTGRVRVTDFGVARIVDARPVHGARVIVGTPAYMAPEQRRGDPTDARTDQFAFCASLREALAAAAPPRWLQRVIARGMGAAPAARFASMDALLAAIADGRVRRRRRATRLAAVAAAALVALVVSSRPTRTRVITQVSERVVPAARPPGRELAPAWPLPATPAIATRASVAPPIAVAARAAAAVPASAARTVLMPRRAPSLHVDPPSLAIVDEHDLPASRDDEPSDGLASETIAPGFCDDGSVRTCAAWAPGCPAGTIAAIQQGCWTCADEQTCSPLGAPRTCNDGTPLRCTQAPPTCEGRRIPAVRGGCWSCEDPFTCWTRSQPLRPPPARPRCGNAVCERGESATTCARDCRLAGGPGEGSGTGSGSGSGSGAGSPVCGNGFCELGEDHAGCASDCCETGPDGACRASCGNGFCEVGEDHAACASDCCELGASGACAPVCGNGFCEEAETGCASDCS